MEDNYDNIDNSNNLMDQSKYKIKIKSGLSILNIFFIVILFMLIIFIICIEYLHNEDGGVKEIVVNLEEPQFTLNAYDIVIFPLIVGIYFLATSKKEKTVDATITVSKDKINIEYLNKFCSINVSNIKNIKYIHHKRNDSKTLYFIGNKKMAISNNKKNYAKYEITLINDDDKLYDTIHKITGCTIEKF